MSLKKDRWKDPAAWECLSDEQRDTIEEWYKKVSQTEKEERAEQLKISKIAGHSIVVPISVWYAVSEIKNGGGVLWFIGNLIAAIAVFWIVSFVCYQLSEFACREGYSRNKLFAYWFVFAIVTFLLAISVYF